MEYDSSKDVGYYLNESLNPFYVPETCSHRNLQGLGGRLNAYGWYMIRTSLTQGKVWPYLVEERGSGPGNYGVLIAAKHVKSNSPWYLAGDVDVLSRRTDEEQHQAENVHEVLRKFGAPAARSMTRHLCGKECKYSHMKFSPMEWILGETVKQRTWRRRRKKLRAVYVVLQARLSIIKGGFKSAWWDLVGLHQGNDYYELMAGLMRSDGCRSKASMSANVRNCINLHGEEMIGKEVIRNPEAYSLRLIKRKTPSGLKVLSKV